jgi:hypothetical protein
MFTSTAKLFLSEAIAQNRYLPIGYKLWYLYGEWDKTHPCYTSSSFADPGTANYDTPFHQQVSDVSIG